LVEDLDQILDPRLRKNQVTLKNAFILTMDPGKIQGLDPNPGLYLKNIFKILRR